MENLPIDVLEDILFRLSVKVALQAKRVCTTWEALLASKFSWDDYVRAEFLEADEKDFLKFYLAKEFLRSCRLKTKKDYLPFGTYVLQEGRAVYVPGHEIPSAIRQRKTVPPSMHFDEFLDLLTQNTQSSTTVKNEVSHSSRSQKHMFREGNRRINKRKDNWKRKL